MAQEQETKMGHKILEIKDLGFGDGDGVFSGHASVTENLDRKGDIIDPGAYSNLPELVHDGAGMYAHNWSDLPIATISEAREDEEGLFFVAVFHSHDDAQKVREVMKERMERGKSVAMSIGFKIIDSSWEVVDEDKYIRHLKKIEVYEISIVPVPANPKALVEVIKAVSEESAGGRPLKEHSETVLATVEDFVNRLKGLKEKRADDDRDISGETLVIVKAVRDKIEELDEILLPNPSGYKRLVRRQRHLRLSAQLTTLKGGQL